LKDPEGKKLPNTAGKNTGNGENNEILKKKPRGRTVARARATKKHPARGETTRKGKAIRSL